MVVVMNAPPLVRTRRRITVDQYFREVGETEERFELIDGEIFAMAGGSREHARAGRELVAALVVKLRGGPCEPFGSDMGLRLNDWNFRYPDAAIYCDPRDLGPEGEGKRVLSFPKAVFEVLSPSTGRSDRAIKLSEYKALTSVAAVAFVDLDRRTVELHERTGPAAWTQREVGGGDSLVLTDPAVTLAAAELFGD